MAKRITIDELSPELAKLVSVKIKGAAVRGIHSAAYRLQGMVPISIAETKPYPPQDTGELTRSIKTTKKEDGAFVKVDAPHAPFMEYGTRPHFPPIEPIKQWVWRKMDVATDEEAEEIAWLICWKIFKYGIQPRHFMLRALQTFKRQKILKQEIDRELKEVTP